MTLFKRLFGNNSTGTEPGVGLFIETMLLMIAADGQVDDREMAQFMREVRSRPEFEDIAPEAVNTHVERAFESIKTDGVPARVRHITAALPDREQRIAATTMAVSIAMGDGQLGPAEATLLKMLSDAFSLTGDEVANIVAAATLARTELESARQSPVERLYVETMMLMAAADGDFDPAEVEVFADKFANHPAFKELMPNTACAYIEKSLTILEEEGVESRLDAICNGLTHNDQREIAFRLAVDVCMADGLTEPYETELLKILAERLNLSEELVASCVDGALGRESAQARP
jgi:tellurite resistance protein